MTFLEDVKRIVAARGDELYGGEQVTQTQHALQCATLAEADGAPPHLIAAALLHDIGHLIDSEFEAALTRREDRHHEDLGCAYLAQWFGPEVTEPVRLHVDAKRYLCAVDKHYFATLSQSSVNTLEMQGGPFSQSEAREFMAQTHSEEAVRLRLWDDKGKDPDMGTPDIEHFLPYLEQVMKPAADS